MADVQEKSGVDSRTIEAFHMMWDSFPHVVLLLRKTREIVAANKRAEEKGFHRGAKCFQIAGQTEIHAGCKANTALEEGVCQRAINYNKDTGRVMDAYWLPIPTENDLYVHFAIDIKPPTSPKS